MSIHFSASLKDRDFEVEFSVADGQRLAVMGANGAGKSTLLALLAGTLRPDSGQARIGDSVLFDLPRGSGRGTWLPPHRRRVGLLAQDALLFPHLTAAQNVAFGPRSRRVPSRRSGQEALRWLTHVGADALSGRRPETLSGGQAQRVALARALATVPKLLLLDEPMSALDVAAEPELRQLLQSASRGRPTVTATHDLMDAVMLSERLLVLESGHVLEHGATSDVLARPRTDFAAGLAGMNLLRGTAKGGCVQTPGGTVSGRVASGTVLSDGVAVGAAFSPSAVAVYRKAPEGSPRNGLVATVISLQSVQEMVRVRAKYDRVVLNADITAAGAADLGLRIGESVTLVVKAAQVTIYPL